MPQIERVLREAIQGLKALPDRQSGQWLGCAWLLVQLVFHHRDVIDAPKLMRAVVDEAGRSTFHDTREKGEARGRVRGERDLLLGPEASRFGVPDAPIVARLEAIQSLEDRDQLAVRLLTVEIWQVLLSELRRFEIECPSRLLPGGAFRC